MADNVEFKMRLRQEYERLKKLKESQDQGVVKSIWKDNR